MDLSRDLHAGQEQPKNRTAHTQQVIMTVNKSIFSTNNMNVGCEGIQTTRIVVRGP
jgi:hypothetical protein